MKTHILFILIISAVFSGFLFADDGRGGGGGIFVQKQVAEFPFAQDWDLAETNMELQMIGGFGYGVSNSGQITGGFGYGIITDEDENGDEIAGQIAGGFGGVINGVQILSRPITLNVITYVGLGGMGRVEDEDGWFALCLQANVEVGIPLGFVMPVVLCGISVYGRPA